MGTLELNVVATLYRALSSSYSCLLRAEPSLSSAPFGMEFLSPADDDDDDGLQATLFLQQHPIRPRSVRTPPPRHPFLRRFAVEVVGSVDTHS